MLVIAQKHGRSHPSKIQYIPPVPLGGHSRLEGFKNSTANCTIKINQDHFHHHLFLLLVPSKNSGYPMPSPWVCIIFRMAVHGHQLGGSLPLPNIQKTIENSHLWRVFPLIAWWFFRSYVKLPEGIAGSISHLYP